METIFAPDKDIVLIPFQRFRPDELREIKKVTMARILCNTLIPEGKNDFQPDQMSEHIFPAFTYLSKGFAVFVWLLFWR